MGDCHARFCERLELKCSGLLDLVADESGKWEGNVFIYRGLFVKGGGW